MRKASFADMHCSIAQSLEVVGEWWTLLILRDAFLGVRRFDDFVERLGISRNILTNRLDTLVATGILERRPYDEARGRYDYLLTDKGRALWPVMTALASMGRPVDLRHRQRAAPHRAPKLRMHHHSTDDLQHLRRNPRRPIGASHTRARRHERHGAGRSAPRAHAAIFGLTPRRYSPGRSASAFSMPRSSTSSASRRSASARDSCSVPMSSANRLSVCPRAD